MRPTRTAAALALAVAACAPAGGGPAPEAAPCPVRLATADVSTWRVVQAEGFTFCVPPTWRPAGSRAWRGGAGEVEWGQSAYTRTATKTETVRVVAGQPATPPQPLTQGRRFTEMVGGYGADFWDNEDEGTFYTGAVWTAPRHVHVAGEARSRATANVQLDVYRTVRFTERD